MWPNDLIPAHAGMNRMIWDLRYDDPVQIPGAFLIKEKRRVAPLWRQAATSCIIKMGEQTRTAPLTVVADPRVADSGRGDRGQNRACAGHLSRHRFPAPRGQRHSRQAQGAENRSPHPSVSTPDSRAMEEALMQVNMNGSEANLAFQGMLNEQLAAFAGHAWRTPIRPPTTQQQSLYASLHDKLQAQLMLWRGLQQK